MNEHLSNQEQNRVLKRLLSYMKPHKKAFVVAFSLLILTTIADIVGPILIKIFIDDYLTPRNLDVQPLTILVSIYLLVNVSKVMIQYLQSLKFQEIALTIIQEMRVDLFSKVQHLGMKYFDQTPTGSIISRVTNDTEAIKDMFVEVVSTFLQNGVLLIGIFVAMFILDVKLALFCLILLPCLFALMKTYRHFSSIYYKRMRERLSQLNAKLNESLQGMAIIQVFRQERRLRKEFQEINDQHYEAGIKNIKLDGLLLRPAVDVLYVLSIIMVLNYFGISAMDSPIEIGVLYAFVSYLDRFFEPVNQMMMRLSIYQQAIIAASRVFQVLDEREMAPAGKVDSEDKINVGEVEFQNVTFSYDGERDVLKNITFKVKKGETVALVGHTGSGKSSIINLLLRFYDTKKGRILIDGKSIETYSNHELRKHIGLVLQDPFLFANSVHRNIALHDEQMSRAEVERAAQFVQANSFIKTLPDQYDEVLVERGSTLSSGQRQLVAFARTIARDPKILVLDEATAHIDTETEESIQEALDKMRKGRTTIAIAHRLSTIQNADNILVLYKGEIVEQGNHHMLIKQKGLYYKMYLLQNGLDKELGEIAES
ncbi:ABC transporter ATP-binding protein [Metabacillus iocasae]|uniref:ATP-binding cassette subfamily B protein n=1 Tax=Priestia iocasae TaxID=2291674 RepID=A0ABS2QR91_9BACI|nr:ABC transporter transmembrane domain-containing protein [Metabacillus iocasae]MBM7701970.1 ATP-binding cassette subfamily B protein [Metabacillus iocasae]